MIYSELMGLSFQGLWANTKGAKISSMSHANSDFHGDRFTHGGEDRRVGMLGWDFHNGLFVVVRVELEGLVIYNHYVAFS